MKKIIIAAAFAVIATGASAQASNFEGFSAGLNLNTVASNTKFAFDTISLDGIGQQSWNGALQGAYGFVTSPSTVVSVGVTYGLGKSKAGALVDSVGSANFEVKNQLSVYVEPGFLINNSTLIYGKMSYEKAKIDSFASDDETISKSINGTGFGFGARTMIAKTAYIQVEIKQIGYGSAKFDGTDTAFKTKSAVGTVGIGMKF
jgi:opacity protein-like surface antigen